MASSRSPARPTAGKALGGLGTAVDRVIEMVRFDQEQLFDRLAARQALDRTVMTRLAGVVAAFHAQATPCPDYGGVDAMLRVIDGNEVDLAEHGAAFLDRATCRRVADKSRALVTRHAALLDTRKRSGYVRYRHGDLHLRNPVLLDGEPTLFDGVELNDDFARIDVLYDLAFLLMDLETRDLAGHANVVLNRDLAETGDHRGISRLPWFMSCRAAIRAKTSATAAAMQHDDQRIRELQRLSSRYLALAEQLLRPAGRQLVAIGGLLGTGKSTLARHLAPRLGAIPAR